jgi:hypothetical protein
METISLGGRPVSGFAALGENVSTNKATPVLAAVMVGSTVGLLAHMFKARTGYAILLGAGATVIAHYGIDRASQA